MPPTVDGGGSPSETRQFLTSRRARISPEQAGLGAYGSRRRVSGLRREEVALLAGISVEYYVQLERGSVRGVSEDVMDLGARIASRPGRRTPPTAELIDGGGVPEVDAELHGLPEERLGGLLVQGPRVEPPGGVAVAHAAERAPADLQARSSH